MKCKKKKLAAALVGAIFTLVSTLVSFAGEVTYSFPSEPTVTKTIRFQLEGGAEEYRFRKGAAGEDGFSGAKKAGSGSGAEITVEENGVYTLYAKQDENIYYVQVPVTTVDHTPPTIRVTDIISTDEKRVSVYYEVDDYYGVEEVRYIRGNVPASGYSQATVTSGGVIEDLQEGTYTLFARDLAGNITVYAMAVTCDYSETEQSSQYESKSEAYESTEWAKSDLWVEPSTTIVPETPSSELPTTAPETTSPHVTEPDPTTPHVTETDSTTPEEPVTYPEKTTGWEPETEPEETSPPELVPTNPTEPPSKPPVERYPQTGSLLAGRLFRAFIITFLFIAGCGLLILGRTVQMHEKGGEGEERHED